MRIYFHIHYNTVWGQQLAVVGDHPLLGTWNPEIAVPMAHQGDGRWVLQLELPDSVSDFSYAYVLVDNNTKTNTREWGDPRLVTRTPDTRTLRLIDHWRSHQHADNALYTAPFREVLLPAPDRTIPVALSQTDERLVTFQCYAPRVRPDADFVVLGGHPELGSWEPGDALVLGNPGHPLWSGTIQLDHDGLIEYKYAWRNRQTGAIIDLESGPNRTLSMGELEADHLVVTDDYFRYSKGPWRGAGVAIPVFSLRSDQSFGVGEFADLKLMVNWAKESGLKMVQVLPVNDTTATHSWTDSYPYAAISVFALHPIFLRIADLKGASKVLTKKVEKQRQSLNRLPQVDYEAVTQLKRTLAWEIFSQQKEAFLKSADFKAFHKEHKHWLNPYAVFCYLRDHYGTADFSRWDQHAKYSKKLKKELCSPDFYDFDAIAFSWFLQFHLDKQLREAADYARGQGVILKGDLPIGIYRHSVDAWVAPQLYNMDAQAGAPPDPFSETGQNWGFPTYNWTEMAKDNYQWWRNRMTQLSRYFDTYRIDHILGFFRIWQIPLEQIEGTLGYFNPAIPVTPEELESRGLSFNRDRYCKPYITQAILEERFGDSTAQVKAHFLTPLGERYQFKEGLDNQRAIQKYLSDKPDLQDLQKDLFDLIGEVLFIEDPERGPNALHPRIELMKTRSYAELDDHARGQVHQVYIDYFYRRQEEFWKSQAMEKLPALKEATDMLICGEDLGMVPACVPDVMSELSILSLEIQRMSKNPQTEFLQVEDIPYLSVASPSTHDMAPIRAWWEEEEWDYIQRFYEQELRLDGNHPKYCEPFVAQAIIRQHLSWPSMWTVFPLQDLLAMDGRLRVEDPHSERINIPANPKHYWRYRMHLSLEDLIEEKPFMYLLRAMLQNGNRI